MDDYSIVIINGSHSGSYYVSDSQVEYLTSDFGNCGGSTIYLYSSKDKNSYISIDSLGYAYYRSSSSYSSRELVNDVTSIEYNDHASYIRSKPYISLFVYFIVACCMLLKVVKR